LRKSVVYEFIEAAQKAAHTARDCPTCAHLNSPGGRGPCKSCTVLWKPENGGYTDNWTPVAQDDAQTGNEQPNGGA
jgi:hypothetical protein